MSEILSSAPLPRPEAHSDEGPGKIAGPDEPKTDSNAIVIKINKDDAVEIDGVPFRDMADVTIRMRQMRDSGGAETSILVIGHGDASHGTAAALLDAAYEVGINHLRLAVIDDESE
jgi:biopolymer transport protein ExbD